jgi:ankyrin repeat protein
MSFICNWENSGDAKENNTTCPGCQVPSESLADTDIQCNNCRMWFRRIAIIEEFDPPPHTPVPTPWRSKSEFGKSGFTGIVSGPVRPGKKRLAPNDVDGDDDPREFKRVRMISKIRQIKQRHFGNTRANGGLKTFSALSNATSLATSTLHIPMPEVNTPMIPGDVMTIPEASKEALLNLAEVIRRDLEIARQMGLLKALEIKPGLDLPVPHSEPVNKPISSTSLHTNEQASPPHERYIQPPLDMLFCHGCSSKWCGYEYEIACPECGSEFTQLIEDSVDSQKVFLRAAKTGNKAVVKLLLETGKVDVNLKDRDGWTPLSIAASYGNEAVVKMLLDTGKVDANVKNGEGCTQLLIAALNGNETVVKMLLDTGKVDVNLKDGGGWTPLSRAASNRHETIVKMLVDTGKVDVNLKDGDGWTPLFSAALNGHAAVVKMLLDTGKVDVNLKDGQGRTPLSGAASYGNEAVVKMLLDTGKADVNSMDSYKQTPLSRAALNGHEAIIKMLLDLYRQGKRTAVLTHPKLESFTLN